MKRRTNDHELTDEIVAQLDAEGDGELQPGMKAKALLQQASDAGSGDLRMTYLQQAQREIAKLDPARHGRVINQLQSAALALQGRRGDTQIAHVTPGEIVIPLAVLTPDLRRALAAAVRNAGIDPRRLVVGDARNSTNPKTGAAEFGLTDWLSGLFGDQGQSPPDSEENPGAVRGMMEHGAETGTNAANVRADYVDNVHALDAYDNPGRELLKSKARDASPPELRANIDKFRPGLGPNPGSVGRANVTNSAVNQTIRRLGAASKGLAGVNAALALTDIATSDNPARTTAANAGAMAGGLLGGAAGGALGLLGGPAAFVTAPGGAIAGSAYGGIKGYEGGENAFDYLQDAWKRRF